jgi:hypothetical protein
MLTVPRASAFTTITSARAAAMNGTDALSKSSLAQPLLSRRASASVVLCGVTLIAGLAMLGSVNNSPGASKKSGPRLLTAVGTAPAFCKDNDQTWPNIDPRCVKRVEPEAAAASPAVMRLETATRPFPQREQTVVNSRRDPSALDVAALPAPSGSVGAPVAVGTELVEQSAVPARARTSSRRAHRSRSFGRTQRWRWQQW